MRDIRNRGLEEPLLPEVFVPSTIPSFGFASILLRTSADSRRLTTTIRRELRAIDKNVVQSDPALLDDLIAKYSYSRPQFSVFLMSAFAGIGLLLVGTDIYGVMAYAVSQQTREIGIRMAFGAEQAQVFRAVFGVAIRLIRLGLASGTLSSLLTNRLVAKQVWTVSSFDPAILLAGIAAIVILGLAACYSSPACYPSPATCGFASRLIRVITNAGPCATPARQRHRSKTRGPSKWPATAPRSAAQLSAPLGSAQSVFPPRESRFRKRAALPK